MHSRFSGRHNFMEKVTERRHRAPRVRDRRPKDTKIIRAIDQQTKTISMPNAVAMTAGSEKRFGTHMATGSNGCPNRFAGSKNRGPCDEPFR
jgi:hypothetical protein